MEFWETGKIYIVRTVTMIFVGKLKGINQQELLLEKCAWIPETSRWSDFVKGTPPHDIEPFASDVIVARSSLVDATVVESADYLVR